MEQTYPDYENLSLEAKAFLDLRHNDIDWGTRIGNCLRNDGQIFVRQSVIKTEDEMLTMQPFGRKSLTGMKGVFDNYGLHFGMKLPPEVVSEGSAAYEAKKRSALPPQSEVLLEIKSPADSSIQIGDEMLALLQECSKLDTDETRGNLARQVLKIFSIILDQALEHLSYDRALLWHNRLLSTIIDIPHIRGDLGPLLYKLWGVVEKTKTAGST